MFNKCFKNSCCPVVSECNMPCAEVMECPINKCIQKDYVHSVKHIIPVHTNVVNNHIYKHSYVPEFTYSEECIQSEVYDNNF